MMSIPVSDVSNDPLLWILTAATLFSTILFFVRGKPKVGELFSSHTNLADFPVPALGHWLTQQALSQHDRQT